ncbi:hypothetical protein Rhe02_88570 [Rhizocola hellebori]|uniref:DUF1579 domain-containing protein n=2 Tax=Rhizocola hellebori TaxID=1392758 RepID=A0A8J3QJA7_9ACTN|nr:hypothetical protein Rhe02_88570 [Rhizocola hellebori]
MLAMAQDDFDFFHGSWTVRNRKRAGEGWTEFPATCTVRALIGGIGFIDEMSFPETGTGGSTIGLYDSERDLWAHYWVSTRNGVLQPAVYGSAAKEFYGDDELDGKPMRVRYLWDVRSHDDFGWEQAFSFDDGNTWEVDWVMDFSRVS